MSRWTKVYVFVPVVAAVTPIVALIAGNPGEGITASDIFLPTVISVVSGLLAWLLVGLFTRDPNKRLLVSTAAVAWFVAYGVIPRGLNSMGAGALLEYPASLFIVLSTAIFVGVIALARSRHAAWLAPFTAHVVVILFALQVAQPLFRRIRNADVLASAANAQALGLTVTPELPDPDNTARPDIYYVVLDSYTGAESLSANYGFDNTPFLDKLRDLGFAVPMRSRANYVMTYLALAAALNWQYLEWIPEEVGANSRDRSIPHWMMEQSRTVRFLKDIGYEFVFLPTSLGMTRSNRLADVVLPEPAPAFDPGVVFGVVWLSSTAILPVVNMACALNGCDGGVPFAAESPQRLAEKFDLLADVPKDDKPRFVLAHVMLPHEPFVFDRNCGIIDVAWSTDFEPDSPELRRAYVEQVECTNRMTLAMVTGILETSEEPPIIILQSDHGYGRFMIGRPPEYGRVDENQMNERFDIFAAYYLPGGGDSVIYDSISPVNVLPRVLRFYFGIDMPQLDDRHFYSSWVRPYRFVEIDFDGHAVDPN